MAGIGFIPTALDFNLFHYLHFILLTNKNMILLSYYKCRAESSSGSEGYVTAT